MTKRSTRWMLAMQEKYNTSEEGVREIMRARQRKSMEHPNRQKGVHTGGFSNIELAKQAGKKGLDSRWGTGTTESSKG